MSKLHKFKDQMQLGRNNKHKKSNTDNKENEFITKIKNSVSLITPFPFFLHAHTISKA